MSKRRDTMTKKEQAIAAVKKGGLAAAFEEGAQALRSAREGIEAFEGDERQVVQEAYAELTAPSCRRLLAEAESFLTVIEARGERAV
jgi:hypothetical protein